MIRQYLLTTMALLTLGGIVTADDAQRKIFETPEAAQADPDFEIQGEYAGENVGVQVIALGNHNFRVVTFAGGLPGAGSDGSRTTVEGKWDDVKSHVAKPKTVHRESPTLGKKAPAEAVVLFDGSEESLKAHWQDGARKTEDGLLMEGVTSTDEFGDFSMHIEFRLPYMPYATGQARGNSGLYLQGRYEVQMLDSFGLNGESNECGGIYQAAAPALNMCLPPLSWQTYDIDFKAAKFDSDGKKTANASATVKHNGVVIHDNVEIPQGTPGGPIGTEGATSGPIFLQNHGDPVRYRNIWVLPQ